MKNPLVIFFARDRNVAGWRYTGAKIPLAWSDLDEQKDPERDEAACKILVLNDQDRDIPTLRHTNCDPESELLVVRHYGSTHHRADVLRDQLKHLGKYESIGSFSHDAEDAVFNRIRDLLDGRLSASSFVQYFQKTRQRKLFIDLAAICQIGLLGAPAVNEDLLESVLYQLPQDFQEEFNNAHGIGQDNWTSAIGVILSHAAAIAV